jgi:hypothetical protein
MIAYCKWSIAAVGDVAAFGAVAAVAAAVVVVAAAVAFSNFCGSSTGTNEMNCPH